MPLSPGGGAGIGEGIVQELVSRGARVAIADVDRSTTESLAANMASPNVMVTEVDVARSDQVAGSVNEVPGRFGRVDTLVNCAGWKVNKKP